MIIDVPHKDQEGNLVFTASLNEEQVQAVLQFGLNFLMTAGLATTFGIVVPETTDDDTPIKFDD